MARRLFGSFLTLFVATFAQSQLLQAQFHVSPVHATGSFPASNVDSCAVWAAPEPLPSLLFVTEKDGDRIEVWQASTGAPHSPRPFLGGPIDGTGAGELNRPNGVWVLYHVPHAGGFTDILLVTDQLNQRVQVFRLPELEYFGELGAGQVGKGYGIAWYQDGTDFFIYITDQTPPGAFPGKLKKYRLRPEGSLLGGDLVLAFGAAGGSPPLPNVESIVADFPLNRLHVCGDEGGKLNRIFQLDGTYTGTDYGDPQFEFDQEGINLYDTGNARGYLIVSDQHTDGTANQFELFDRATLASLGNFESPAGGALVTRNTDGAYLEQRPFPGFPNGAFCAVNDDHNCHVYDWTDIAEAMGLEIVALDRPFAALPGKGPASAAPSRSALWFHDGSWWGALPLGDSLSIARLEDGTFSGQTSLGPPQAASVWSRGEALAVFVGAPEARVLTLDYEAARRRYVPRDGGAPVTAVTTAIADFAVEATESGTPVRGWAAWVSAGEVHVTWSDPSLQAWDATGVSCGPSASVLPRLVRLSGAIGLAWAESNVASFRLHPDGNAPGSWEPRETISQVPLASLGTAALPDGSLLVAGADALGGGTIWRRTTPGGWAAADLTGEVRDPALVVDAARSSVHIFHAVENSGHRTIQHRSASLAELPNLMFGPSNLSVGWPSVDQNELFSPGTIPPEATDLVVTALGSDGFGHFGRVFVAGGEDRQAPITLQHIPAPDSFEVAESSTIQLRITDDRAGVDRTKLRLLVNGVPRTPRIRGAPRNLLVSYQLPPDLSATVVTVRIEATDLAEPPHRMAPFEYQLVLGPPGPSRFLRGDANEDGQVDISDVIRILLALFARGSALGCSSAGDANDDEALNVSDAVYLLAYLFTRGSDLPPPSSACGLDPTAGSLSCSAPAGCGQ